MKAKSSCLLPIFHCWNVSGEKKSSIHRNCGCALCHTAGYTIQELSKKNRYTEKKILLGSMGMSGHVLHSTEFYTNWCLFSFLFYIHSFIQTFWMPTSPALRGAEFFPQLSLGWRWITTRRSCQFVFIFFPQECIEVAKKFSSAFCWCRAPESGRNNKLALQRKQPILNSSTGCIWWSHRLYFSATFLNLLPIGVIACCKIFTKVWSRTENSRFSRLLILYTVQSKGFQSFIYLKKNAQTTLKVCCFFFISEPLKWIYAVEMCWTTRHRLMLLYLARPRVQKCTMLWFSLALVSRMQPSRPSIARLTPESEKRRVSACDLHTHCQQFPLTLPPCAQHTQKNLQRMF